MKSRTRIWHCRNLQPTGWDGLSAACCLAAVEKFVKGGGATRPSEKRSKITQHKDGMITVELRNAAGWLAT